MNTGEFYAFTNYRLVCEGILRCICELTNCGMSLWEQIFRLLNEKITLILIKSFVTLPGVVQNMTK